ncbi:semaphorin-1A isoform X3 [Rhipicephalus sanguineus]|uniref:semaphorin-1A isoform X3 n=1 Tax=Rhipicephalus sanguineus TaxID=34632 RepID=UPI001895EC66|nr:semaphorin-1A isoform X3 [Rhipicephalus sanguineus]
MGRQPAPGGTSCSPPPPPRWSTSWLSKLRLVGALAAALVLTLAEPAHAAWQDALIAKKTVAQLPPDLIGKFRGNQTHSDHFRLLEQDGHNLLVGARNVVYNISLSSLELQKKLEWFSESKDIDMCKLKGKSEEACQNYIRVLARKSETVIFVCGTNAYKPRCRDYVISPDGEYTVKEQVPGEGLCPFDPKNNSTAIFADGDLYVATVGQLSGADPLIYRKPLRTEPFDLKHLNAPNFVSSIHYEDYVYFFFRESAVEYINCGKTVYSRVARVCTRDKGGPHKFQQRWTSFLKARLNCSVGGDIPFYFNEIQSTSPIVDGIYNGKEAKLIYSVFTTPHNSISGSAVCAFRVEDIQRVFEGSFKGQDDINSNWLPIVNSKVPEPRPGQCVNDSRTLPDVTLNFITEHPLMDQAVPSHFGRPILVHTGFQYRFTYIAVDPQVETVSGKKYDVLFIGTDTGRVLKAVNVPRQQQSAGGHPVLVEDVGVFQGAPVTNLLVHRPQGRLVVVTHSEIQAVPLFGCQRYAATCADCVALQDPYCAWDSDRSTCVNPSLRVRKKDSYVQNIEEGWDHRCGQGVLQGASGVTASPPVSVCPPCDCTCPPPPTLPPTSSPPPTEVDDPDMAAEEFNDLTRPQFFGRPPSSNGPLRSPHQYQGSGMDDAAHPNSASRPLGDGHEGAVAGSSLHGDQRTGGSSQFYTAETLAIAVTTSIVASLVVGFISGYIFSRRCRSDEEAEETCPPDDYSRYLDRGGDPHSEGFLSSTHNHAKPINLVLNVPPKNGKNANSSADNKPLQKVKKIYL